MILTQDMAKKWAKILQGFADGKKYKYPFMLKETPDGEYTVVKYKYINDFDMNPDTPTISLTNPNMSLIDVDYVEED